MQYSYIFTTGIFEKRENIFIVSDEDTKLLVAPLKRILPKVSLLRYRIALYTTSGYRKSFYQFSSKECLLKSLHLFNRLVKIKFRNFSRNLLNLLTVNFLMRKVDFLLNIVQLDYQHLFINYLIFCLFILLFHELVLIFVLLLPNRLVGLTVPCFDENRHSNMKFIALFGFYYPRSIGPTQTTIYDILYRARKKIKEEFPSERWILFLIISNQRHLKVQTHSYEKIYLFSLKNLMQEYKGLDFINGKYFWYLYLPADLQNKSCSEIKKLASEISSS